MSDGGDNGSNGDGGYGGDSYDSGPAWQPSRSSSGASDWGVLRRAMRWETFALVLFLVVLAVVAS
ncbi:hypothetical protein [Streptomyces auratus]|uniref:Uncharacterized protein n=1 Tax=Streptomyces auratus AGR0001 TaxID=1160718 RepID=J1ZML4_9ACTN|nr:hypothetical protein [Streptomyces auratus]QTZ95486.1 hypothetical protein SU9_031825 [Streptomyces auratus AGR0001]